MRSHHLWPRKSQNRIIPVNLEAIQMTTITSKLFQTLYLGYYQVLHYIVYGLCLRNFDISSAFTSDWHPRTYLLSSKEVKLPAITAIQYRNSLNRSMFLAFHWSPWMV